MQGGSLTLTIDIDASGAKVDIAKLANDLKNALANGDAALAKNIQRHMEAAQAANLQLQKVEELQAALASLSTLQPTPDNSVAYAQYEGLRQKIADVELELDRLNTAKEMLASSGLSDATLDADIEQLSAELRVLQADAEKARLSLLQMQGTDVQSQTTALTQQIQNQSVQLELLSSRARIAGAMAQGATQNTVSNLTAIDTKVKTVSNGFGTLGNMIARSLMRVAVYSTIGAGLRSLIGEIGAAIMSNENFRASLNNLQSALWTAFAPIYSYVVPALTTLINFIASAINSIVYLISVLTGASFGAMQKNGKALRDQTNAYKSASKGAGKAAKKTKDHTKATKDNTKAMKDQTKEAEKQLAAFDDLEILQSNLADDKIDEDKVEEPKVDEPAGGGGGLGGLGDIFSGVATDIELKLRDILFNWENLTAEDILKKLVLALSAIGGAIIGFSMGGIVGGILGTVAGVTIGLGLDNVLFNDDDKLDKEEIVKSIGALLFSLLGAYIGFKYMGVKGAAMGFEAAALISMLLLKCTFDNDGKLSGMEIANSIGQIVISALGAVIGYLAFGVAGAALGFTLGSTVALALSALYARAGDGTLDARSFALGIGAVIGGVLGALLGGSFLGIKGAALGFAVGATIGVIIQSVSLDENGNLTDIGKRIYGYLKIGFSLFGMTLDAATHGMFSKLLNTITLTIEILTAEEAAKKQAAQIAQKIAKDIDDGVVEGLRSTPDGNFIISEYEDKFLSGTQLKAKSIVIGKEAGEETVTSYGIGFNQTTPFLDYTRIEPDATILKSDGEEAGKEMVNGLQSGVTNHPFTFITWAQMLIDGFKELFGIHSPSTVFAKFGRDIVDGLVNGLKSSGQAIITFFQTIWGNIQSIFQTDVGTKFQTWFNTGWANIKSIFSQNNLSTWFTQRWKDVTDIFGDSSTGVEQKFSDWFTQGYTNLTTAFQNIGQWATDSWKAVTDIFGSTSDGVEQKFTDWFTQGYTNLNTAFENIGDWATETWKAVTGVFGGEGEESTVASKFKEWFQAGYDGVTGIFDKLDGYFSDLWAEIQTTFSNLGTEMADAIGGAVKTGLNGVINWIETTLNKAINLINGAIDLINNVPGVSIGKINQLKLPRLAQGAVIPPNRPFAAILGDQRSGYNIETPLETMVQAFTLALDNRRGKAFGDGNMTVVLEIDGREFGRAVVEQGNIENRRIGTRLVTI